MASKRRLRRRECGHKGRYPTRGHAVGAMLSLLRSGKAGMGRLHTYHCGFCGGWHYGHYA